MDDEPTPVPAEELVGKDELDEDDEMVPPGDEEGGPSAAFPSDGR
jgi:hypothetical protein